MSIKSRVVAGLVAAGLASATLYSPSDSGVALVQQHEGLRLAAYLDPVNIPTVCYGSTAGVRLGQVYTEAQCKEILKKDLRTAEAAVKRLVTVPITQGQYDALVSFTFNVGSGNLASSTLLRYTNSGMCYEAARQFDRWVYAKGQRLPGLVKRRHDERGLFEAGCALWPS